MILQYPKVIFQYYNITEMPKSGICSVKFHKGNLAGSGEPTRLERNTAEWNLPDLGESARYVEEPASQVYLDVR